jgi:hypothetical protein
MTNSRSLLLLYRSIWSRVKQEKLPLLLPLLPLLPLLLPLLLSLAATLANVPLLLPQARLAVKSRLYSIES